MFICIYLLAYGALLYLRLFLCSIFNFLKTVYHVGKEIVLINFGDTKF